MQFGIVGTDFQPFFVPAQASFNLAGPHPQSSAVLERRKISGLLLESLDEADFRLVDTTEAGALDELTDKERRVFDLIGEGYSNRQIGEELYIAEKTVKNYVSSVLAKLGMVRRTEAAALAARLDERQKRKYL